MKKRTPISKGIGSREAHTPTPWKLEKVSDSKINIVAKGFGTLAEIRDANDDALDDVAMPDAVFIVRACNNHDALLRIAKKYCDLRSADFCSHSDSCGADNDECYAQEAFQVIAKVETCSGALINWCAECAMDDWDRKRNKARNYKCPKCDEWTDEPR